MALHYDFTDIADFHALHEDESQRVITDALVFASLPLGFGEITKKNAATVYATVKMFERVAEVPMLRNADGTPYEITPEDVHRRIGLKTNAFNSQSPKANITRIVKEHLAELEARYRSETS